MVQLYSKLPLEASNAKDYISSFIVNFLECRTYE